MRIRQLFTKTTLGHNRVMRGKRQITPPFLMSLMTDSNFPLYSREKSQHNDILLNSVRNIFLKVSFFTINITLRQY